MDATVNQPQPVREIFLASFELFKRTWLHLMPLTVFLSIVILSPNLLIYNPHNPWLFLGYFAFSVFVFSSVLYYTWHVNKGENIHLKDAILVAAKKLPIVLIATSLLSAVTLISYAFLIVPGIIVTVWLSMSLPLILMENVGPLAVFRKSYELTTDEWLRTAIVIFLPIVIMSVVSFAITAWVIFYGMNFLYYKIAIALFILVVSFFYLPWTAGLVILQFEYLKKRQAIRALNPQPVNFLDNQESQE